MQAKRVTKKNPDYERVMDIYQEAFPENEKIPVWFLRMMAKRKCIEFQAFYDEHTFCGFAYLIHHENTTFVLYLATDTKIRSKGYGKKILQWISDAYPSNNIALNIETVDKQYDNYEQRLRRARFYLKNDFQQTGFILNDKKNVYDVLYKGAHFSQEEYEKLMKKFTFGFTPVKLEKAK